MEFFNRALTAEEVLEVYLTLGEGKCRTCVDANGPQIHCPADVTVPCQGAGGTVVTFPDPLVIDDCDLAPSVVCTPASGSAFPVGTTTVLCTATDSLLHASTCDHLYRFEDRGRRTRVEKMCSDDLRALIAEIDALRGREGWRRCETCSPH